MRKVKKETLSEKIEEIILGYIKFEMSIRDSDGRDWGATGYKFWSRRMPDYNHEYGDW